MTLCTEELDFRISHDPQTANSINNFVGTSDILSVQYLSV